MTDVALDMALSRRQVVVGSVALTFTFAAGRVDLAEAAAVATERKGRIVSPWVSIDADGSISIMSPATEMGQGSMTSLPRILADELDADWNKVRVVPAPPIDEIYGNPGFGGMLYTAGSNAVRNYYEPLRLLGAAARRVLLENVALRFRVPVSELTTEPSVVVHAKSGRRMTYGEIARLGIAVPTVAVRATPADLKPSSAFRLIGYDTMRVELPSKVNGSAQYAIDVQVPGMLYATVLRAPVEGSSPELVNDTPARAIAGVIRTVRLDYGVGVLARTPYAAIEARQALIGNVTWSRTGTARDFDSDRASVEFAAAARDLSAQAAPWEPRGNAGAELAKAATIIEAEYLNDYTYHAQMEPLNAVASVSPSGDAAEIWCGTQSQTMAQEAVAKVLNIPRSKVTLHDMLMGGGFGRRGHRDEEFIIDAVLMAKAAGAPVKVIWTREDDVHNGRMRPLSAHYLRAGLDADGRIIAWHQRIAVDRVLPFADPVRYANAMGRDGIVMRGTEFLTYDIPNLMTEQLYRDTGVRTSPLARGGVDREHLRRRSLHGRNRRASKNRSGRAPSRAVEGLPARPPHRRTRRRNGGLVSAARAGPSPRFRLCRLFQHAHRRHRRSLGRSYERQDRRARCLVRARLRHSRASEQRRRPDRKQHRLRPRHVADGAHHGQGRRRPPVEFLRLSRPAHERDPGDAYRSDPHREPPDRRRPDGDPDHGARHRQRHRPAHRQAPARKPDDPRPRQTRAGMMSPCHRTLPSPLPLRERDTA